MQARTPHKQQKTDEPALPSVYRQCVAVKQERSADEGDKALRQHSDNVVLQTRLARDGTMHN